MVSVALLTGLAMGNDAGSGSLLGTHVGSIVLIGVRLAAAVIFGDNRSLLRSARRPFSFDRRDVAWVQARLRHPFDRAREPEWGMFNTGQKLLAWALATSIVTGLKSWSAGGEGGLHGATVAVTIALLSAHLFMAVVNTATRPALAGMAFGRVRRSWAAKHHSGRLNDLDR